MLSVGFPARSNRRGPVDSRRPKNSLRERKSASGLFPALGTPPPPQATRHMEAACFHCCDERLCRKTASAESADLPRRSSRTAHLSALPPHEDLRRDFAPGSGALWSAASVNATSLGARAWRSDRKSPPHHPRAWPPGRPYWPQGRAGLWKRRTQFVEQISRALYQIASASSAVRGRPKRPRSPRSSFRGSVGNP